jgi:hypothetical protein
VIIICVLWVRPAACRTSSQSRHRWAGLAVRAPGSGDLQQEHAVGKTWQQHMETCSRRLETRAVILTD